MNSTLQNIFNEAVETFRGFRHPLKTFVHEKFHHQLNFSVPVSSWSETSLVHQDFYPVFQHWMIRFDREERVLLRTFQEKYERCREDGWQNVEKEICEIANIFDLAVPTTRSPRDLSPYIPKIIKIEEQAA